MGDVIPFRLRTPEPEAVEAALLTPDQEQVLCDLVYDYYEAVAALIKRGLHIPTSLVPEGHIMALRNAGVIDDSLALTLMAFVAEA